MGVVGVGAGANADDHGADGGFLAECARGAHADYLLNAVEVKELVGIDAHRGHTHAAAHDGDALILIVAGVAEHIAHGVHADCVRKKVLRDELCPQRVSGHEDGLGDIFGHGGVMGGGGEVRHSYLSFGKIIYVDFTIFFPLRQVHPDF